ncbi:hypothetical protein [uncultured Roseovarius sp.]|uniref:hypothetical protein n=1 Tax=uncultured Roseovarius sp. TaxID=293344 RepID=UPI00260B02BA|nr:hypothetical protein [uncultured Roseovarius sp.]
MATREFDREFERLMQTVRVLRGHFSKIYGEIEADLIRLRFKRDRAGHTKLNNVRRKMREDYDKALELIANQITSVEELKRTRSVLRSAADQAFKFVDEMRRVKKTIDQFAKAAGFLSDLLGALKKILR